MANLFSDWSAEAVSAGAPPTDAGGPPANDWLLVAGTDPALLDFVAYAARTARYDLAVLAPAAICRRVEVPARAFPLETASPALLSAMRQGSRLAAVVFFPGRGQSQSDAAIIDAVAGLAGARRPATACVVGSFLVHLGDRQATHAETEVLGKVRLLAGRTVLFRAGHILSPNSGAAARLRAWSFLCQLVPRHFSSAFLAGEELFGAILRELDTRAADKPRTFTLLGENRSWGDVLREQDQVSWRRVASGAGRCLSRLGIGWLAGLLVTWGSRWLPRLGALNCGTLRPTSARELLELYNKYSYRRVKIVGYNNGVRHFGHRYPGRTVISTVRCNQTARVSGNIGTFDGGVTLRQAIEAAGRVRKEFHVLPNYSYVSVGTAFFIPIHGSASEYSTLADTIERALLYDPVEDRFVSARRGDAEFRQCIYNARRDFLLLRLRVRLKDKTLYYCNRSRRVLPDSREVLSLLQDRRVSNVEIRKGRATGEAVDVYQYYTQSSDDSGAMAVARDAIGHLWDRLEANPLTSALFHGLTRRFAFHVEAFFSPEEFAVFWDTHRTLPVAKIQLRYIRCDGWPHSPFRDHDCVSADLFMLRQHRPAFEAYIKEKFRAVQFNPGKHSA